MRIVLTLAWRNLWRHRTRTLLTASGVALGLGFLLVMLGLGDGSHLQMIDTSVRMGSGHVLVQARGYQQRRGVEMVLPGSLVERIVEWARSRPEIRAVLPRAAASALLSSADGATGVSLSGVDAAAEASVSRFPGRVISGRFLQAGDRNAAIVGVEVARVLKVGVGNRVVAMAQGVTGGEVRSALFRVAGIVRTGLAEVDESLVLVPLPALQEFLAMGNAVHQVALMLEDQGQSRRIALQARAALPGVDVLTWGEADPQLEAAIEMDNGSHYLFNSIFFVLIGFMVLNTLLMSVMERRRELALLGALGLSPRRRLLMVLAEAAMLALLAAVAGSTLGLLGHTYFRVHGLPLQWFTQQGLETAGVMLDPIMRSSLSLRRLIGSAGLVLVLTLLLALFAARQAARPVDVKLLK